MAKSSRELLRWTSLQSRASPPSRIRDLGQPVGAVVVQACLFGVPIDNLAKQVLSVEKALRAARAWQGDAHEPVLEIPGVARCPARLRLFGQRVAVVVAGLRHAWLRRELVRAAVRVRGKPPANYKSI